MTVRVTLNNESWTRIGSGEGDILVTVESGGAAIHIGTDAQPEDEAAGHYITKIEPFNGELLDGEVVWAKGRGSIVVTPGEANNNVPA